MSDPGSGSRILRLRRTILPLLAEKSLKQSVSVQQDFGPVEHQGGISPEWPCKYADLKPYYDRMEELLFVRGESGSDPTDPPRSKAYPYPPVPHEPYPALTIGAQALRVADHLLKS
jgi:hypothetical protein